MLTLIMSNMDYVHTYLQMKCTHPLPFHIEREMQVLTVISEEIIKQLEKRKAIPGVLRLGLQCSIHIYCE